MASTAPDTVSYTIASDVPEGAYEMDEVEARLRLDLCAAYRLVSLYGWDDLVATHISVRMPDDKSFLINPFGMLFDELTPADMVKVDMDGKVLSPTPWPVNLPGFVIHSAIHAVRQDATCAMHLHTKDGVAVSALEEGLVPITQTALTALLLAGGEIAYHEFEGFASNFEERQRLTRDLGASNLMFLRNHGSLAVGPSIAETFVRMYYLETACTIQVRTLGMGRAVHPVDPDVVEKTVAGVSMSSNANYVSEQLVWPAMLRKLDKLDPRWRG